MVVQGENGLNLQDENHRRDDNREGWGTGAQTARFRFWRRWRGQIRCDLLRERQRWRTGHGPEQQNSGPGGGGHGRWALPSFQLLLCGTFANPGTDRGQEESE